MTTYYVRHDGTQTNKANAKFGGAAARALSVSGFNNETFAAGDEIIFENSGTYTSSITFGQTGTAAAPIVMRGPAVDNRPLIQPSSSGVGIRATGEHLRVMYFQAIGNGDDCFSVGANSGKDGDGYTVKFSDCLTVSNSTDDGFGASSPGSDDSQFEYIRCEARAVTGAGNQGFTNHDDQLMRLTDCVVTETCDTALGVIGAGCEINGGTYRAITDVIFASQGCQVVANNANFYADAAATSELVDLNSADTSVTFNDCYCEVTATSTGASAVKAAGQFIRFNGGRLVYAGTGTSGFEYTADGTIEFIGGVEIELVGAMGARLLRNVAGGGKIIVDRASIDVSRLTGTTTRVIFEWRNTSNGLGSRFCHNLIVGPAPQNLIVTRTADGCVATVDIFNNTVHDISASGCIFHQNQKSGATGLTRMRNNILDDVTDGLSGTNGLFKDRNVYSNGTPDESDTNGGTADPVFADADGGDFRLALTSPYRSNGNGLRGAVDLAGRHWVNPPSRGAYQYRGGVRAASARRVAANR
ncbi:MAG: hypothetical protein AB7I42_26075 [Bradyrhizobium sp.]|uniref:hypothetical protein n=1 Tax=Bradyrhizobium sp. TaxID=376 RepID=UPI003D120470